VATRAQRFLDAARKPVPEGTYAVGAGLLVAGITAYGFQILSFRALTEANYAALNGLWVIVFVVAPGLYLPLEQEVSRAIAHRRARGVGVGPLVRRAAVLGGILASCAALASLVFAVPITDVLFHGWYLLLAGLIIALGSYYAAHLTRGTLSGNGRFGAYGIMHGSEGVVRLVACAALFLVGVSNPGWYGLALALPPLAAIAISLRGQTNLVPPGPEAPYSELSTALGFLLLGSLLAQALSYAAFLAATILAEGTAEKEAVGRFIAGLFIARIPILLFQAVQAALLPKLAGLAGAGRHADFRAGLRRLVLVVLAVGAIGTIGGLTLGSWAGALLFGDRFELSNQDLGLLALGSGAFILALTLAQGLIALQGYAQAAIAWVVGIVAFVVAVALGNDLFLRSELGYVVGSSVAAATMAAFLVSRLRRGGPESMEALVQQIEHEPLEI
jgi:O-antigen/teichoic acid export membrane protein